MTHIESQDDVAGLFTPELVAAVAEVLSNWFSKEKLREICDKCSLIETRPIQNLKKEFGSIFHQALSKHPDPGHLFGRIVREFVDDRPLKASDTSWDSWKRGHSRIVASLSQHNLTYDSDGPHVGKPLLPANLLSALRELKSKPAILQAIKKAAHYLQEQKNFEPKMAGDLLRSAIEGVHFEIASELAKIRGVPLTVHNKDGELRAFMRDKGFISKAEERFFSSIYGLISEESVHALFAKRDTVIFIQSTVHNYFVLLLRRLSEEKA